jgi:DNA-directed RNA polymerase subunit RPC12/RpoP
MDEAYGAVCIMCGRHLGCIFQGKYVPWSGTAPLERDGRQYRCGYCHGKILLEPDPTLKPPRDWIAEMKREEAMGGSPTACLPKTGGVAREQL